MARKNAHPEQLRKKERVRAAVDLRGVPEGTEGRVMLTNGVDWIRYWVSFDNGVDMGSLHRDKLVRTGEWARYLVEREEAAERALLAPDESATDEAGPEGGAASGGATVNGVAVPQMLIDRTKAALTRLGVSR